MTDAETFAAIVAAIVVATLAVPAAVALLLGRVIRHADYRAGHVHRCPRCRSHQPATRFISPSWTGALKPCPDRWHDLTPDTAGKEECPCC